MKIRISENVLVEYPTAAILAFGIKEIRYEGNDKEFYSDIKLISDCCLNRNYEEKYNDEINFWKDRYKKMSLSRKKGYSSFESLFKRYSKKAELPNIYPFVDLYNAICLKHGVCIGSYNTENIMGDILLEIVEEDKIIYSIGSNKPIKISPPGVVYSDKEGVICSYWNYRDAERTCVTNETTDILVLIDVGSDKKYATSAMNDFIYYINKYFSCELIKHQNISLENNNIDIDI